MAGEPKANVKTGRGKTEKSTKKNERQGAGRITYC
jgi:hypothetical protein